MIAMAANIILLPIIVLYLFLQRYLFDGIVCGAREILTPVLVLDDLIRSLFREVFLFAVPIMLRRNTLELFEQAAEVKRIRISDFLCDFLNT